MKVFASAREPKRSGNVGENLRVLNHASELSRIRDNSESHFKILKYRPEFPNRFSSLAQARSFCTDFYAWYNAERRHSGIAMHTPFNVHHGRAPAIQHARARVLTTAYTKHPERFVRKPPQPPTFPTTTWINEPEKEGTNSMAEPAVLFIPFRELTPLCTQE